MRPDCLIVSSCYSLRPTYDASYTECHHSRYSVTPNYSIVCWLSSLCCWQYLYVFMNSCVWTRCWRTVFFSHFSDMTDKLINSTFIHLFINAVALCTVSSYVYWSIQWFFYLRSSLIYSSIHLSIHSCIHLFLLSGGIAVCVWQESSGQCGQKRQRHCDGDHEKGPHPADKAAAPKTALGATPTGRIQVRCQQCHTIYCQCC